MVKHFCEVNGNHLVVKGDFGAEAETDLDSACQKLLNSSSKGLVVDACGVTQICSTYVGLLAELCLGAKSSGKELTIKAGDRIAKVLNEAGLGSVANIERSS